MKFNQELKYINGTFNYFKYSTVKHVESKITAFVVIVPGEYFDKHMTHSIKLSLPIFAGAFHKNHPDYDDIWGQIFNPKENIITIRQEAFKLANKKELFALIEHELGHLFWGHTKEIISRYDNDEELADIFIDNYDDVLSLEKKWTIYNYKNCPRCKTKMCIDDKEILNHWFIYCPNCAYWVGDGKLNYFYIDGLVKNRCGFIKDISYKNLKPILSYDEDRLITKIITNSKIKKE